MYKSGFAYDLGTALRVHKQAATGHWAPLNKGLHSYIDGHGIQGLYEVIRSHLGQKPALSCVDKDFGE